MTTECNGSSEITLLSVERSEKQTQEKNSAQKIMYSDQHSSRRIET